MSETQQLDIHGADPAQLTNAQLTNEIKTLKARLGVLSSEKRKRDKAAWHRGQKKTKNIVNPTDKIEDFASVVSLFIKKYFKPDNKQQQPSIDLGVQYSQANYDRRQTRLF